MDFERQQTQKDRQKLLERLNSLQKQLNEQKLYNHTISKENELLKKSLNMLTAIPPRDKFLNHNISLTKGIQNIKKDEIGQTKKKISYHKNISKDRTHNSNNNQLICNQKKSNGDQVYTLKKQNKLLKKKLSVTVSKLYHCQKKLLVMDLKNSSNELKNLHLKQEKESLKKKLRKQKNEKYFQINLLETIQKDLNNFMNKKTNQIIALKKTIQELLIQNKKFKMKFKFLSEEKKSNKLLNQDFLKTILNYQNKKKIRKNKTKKNQKENYLKLELIGEKYKYKKNNKTRLKKKNKKKTETNEIQFLQNQRLLKPYKEAIYQLKTTQKILMHQNTTLFKEFAILESNLKKKNTIINSYQNKFLDFEKRSLFEHPKRNNFIMNGKIFFKS
ncbi:hypothetical protein M0812_20488 [Anaeramoeba flamelloides]|uniref:Uncharacterized protein n=1 Tax=Anaeramoeba flamelloides TaxID=1746091 RepID=A0AAV7YSC0_9EUKA|nr:hypothetical protein M0812_20488 [Anaeramoeba flamelloides]